jgi:hypothetical protein
MNSKFINKAEASLEALNDPVSIPTAIQLIVRCLYYIILHLKQQQGDLE